MNNPAEESSKAKLNWYCLIVCAVCFDAANLLKVSQLQDGI